MNWDDLKYFLAVSRAGSIRGAATTLGVNHATVSRRINSFEDSLDERLFERSAKKGYVCTEVGQEIYREAVHLEASLGRIERRVVGKDRRMQGFIRVTLPDLLAHGLLMSDFADFSRQYPDIELDIIDSSQNLNLSNREADVAFRLCEQPPDHLIGRKLTTIHRAGYIARNHAKSFETELLIDASEEGIPTNKLQQSNESHWLGWTDKMRRPGGKIARDYPRLKSKHNILSGLLQVQACKNGMGVAVLPCFCGDADPDLVRIPPFTTEAQYDLWILHHPDMRHNTKIQTFVRFMVDRIHQQRALIEGEQFDPDALQMNGSIR
jgi:DNA-binding transcriptional LysR family regulator